MKKRNDNNKNPGLDGALKLFQDLCNDPEISSMSVKELGNCASDPKFIRCVELFQRMALNLIGPFVQGSTLTPPANFFIEPTEKEKKEFMEEFGITEDDKKIVSAILNGATFNTLHKEAHISGSTANKRLTELCDILFLENRTQLYFLFGWMRLVELNLPCFDEKQPRTYLSSNG